MRMRNLTLASAKHLLSEGHITPQHHQRIVAAVTPSLKRPKAPAMGGMGGGFGRLLPQQAQAPIPPVANGNPATPEQP